MKSKAALVVGLATGYVLGTRDGRERYEQIKAQATRVWQDPRVQQKATQAQDLAKEKAGQAADAAKAKAPEVKDKATAAAHQASASAKSTAAKSSTTTRGTSPEPTLTADTPEVAVDPHV